MDEAKRLALLRGRTRIELEADVLAGARQDAAVRDVVVTVFVPHDFEAAAHRALFDAIRSGARTDGELTRRLGLPRGSALASRLAASPVDPYGDIDLLYAVSSSR